MSESPEPVSPMPVGEMPASDGWDDVQAQARLRLVLGPERLGRLSRSWVVVLGLGGVGSWCCEALARGGVGNLVVVDRDEVEPSNVNRQAVAWRSTMDRPKVDVMAEMIAQVNPRARVVRVHEFVTPANIDVLFDGLPARPDYVVDAIDTITSKLAVARLASERGLNLVSSMGGANKLDPCRLRFADVSETHGDPMSRVMRKECRKRGIPRLRVLYSDEEPRPVCPPEQPAEGKSARLGTTSYLPPIMGMMLASYVIRELAGLPMPDTPAR